MELKQYLQIVKRWVWLLVLGTVLGAVGGHYFSSLQEPVFQTSTRALVMRPPLEQSSDLTYYSDLQLVQTYIQLLTTQPVLDGASELLGYEVIKDQVKVQQLRDTQIIELTVEDQDPQRAMDIANVLVEVLIDRNESLQAGRYATTETSIRAQITQVESQISSIQFDVDQITTQSFQDQLTEVETQIEPLQAEVSTLQQEIAALTPASTQARRTQIAEKQARIDQIQPLLELYQQIYSNLVVLGKPVDRGTNDSSRLTQLQSTLELYQQLYLNLLSSLETIRLARMQNTPNIVQIEPAIQPEEPIRPRPLMNTALAAVVGLMLAAGIIFLVEYLDDTLKTPEDVERALGLPVLGFIAEIKHKRRKGEDIYITREPRSPVSEAFRTLRTNLEFAAVEKPISTLLVTSPGPTEGKTTVSVNLAGIFCQAKKRVVLVDADMRRPRVHTLMGMTNREGLSNIFLNSALAFNVGRGHKDLRNLLVITSGSPPPNPAELLGSEKMGQILDDLRRNVDLVIIDTPPSVVSDALILSARVDAVLFVIQPGVTQVDSARASLELFKRAGARVVGVVMNRIPRNRGYYYGGYSHYYSYNENKGYFSGNGAKPVEQPVRNPSQRPLEIEKPDGPGNVRREDPAPAPSFLGRPFENSDDMPSPNPDRLDIKK